MKPDDLQFKRLRWRSRRGMLELDLLLIPFFEEVYLDLAEADQGAYELLLEQDDPDLLAWFSQKAIPDDPALTRLVSMILKRVQP
jgi:antitoxin CptB